ncbi:unnamed protein product [Heterobilharzia americana]|nr:unnamed protein product [Heterobilharzia americana]
MKLSDLRITRKPLDRNKTKEIISRVSSFIEESQNVKADSLEGEAEDGSYIELNLLIPSSDANNESSNLPIKLSDSSTECDDSSSESEGESRTIIMQSTVTHPRKSGKLIEELKSSHIDDCIME